MEVNVEKVCYQISDTPILKDISITCKSNKITVIVGPSGSGKSTLLELIASSKIPTSGNITVGAYRTKETSHPDTHPQVHIGYVCSHPKDSFSCQTVQKEFLLALSSVGITKHKQEKIDSILTLMHLREEQCYQSPFSLSFTEQKKVGMAIALLKNPDILILDEPFLGLCKATQKELIQVLRRLKREYGKTIIIATKDTDSALVIADYVYVLWKQKIRLEGNKYDVFKEEKLLSRYGVKEPDLLKFSNAVKSLKNKNIGYRDDMNDLIKDIYRYVPTPKTYQK